MTRLAVALCALLLNVQQSFATADHCGTVTPTPDGFLNLRRGPGTSFEAFFHLFPGDRLWIDTASCSDLNGRTVCDDTGVWWHVTSVRRVDGSTDKFTEGWANRRFIAAEPCPEQEQ